MEEKTIRVSPIRNRSVSEHPPTIGVGSVDFPDAAHGSTNVRVLHAFDLAGGGSGCVGSHPIVVETLLCSMSILRNHSVTRPSSGVEAMHMKDEPVFDHEKLYVYRLSIEFQAWVGELLDEGFGARPKPSAMKHLDDASASISNNIAEGNGARTSPDGQTGAPSHRVDAAQASNEALS